MVWKPYHSVWFTLLFGWMTLYMVRVGMSPALIPIMEEFHLTHSQAGILATAVFLAYTFLQLPAGHLGDRFGRKTFLMISTLGWSVISFFTGFANSFHSLFGLRLLTGLFEGSYFGNDRPIISAYTPKEKMGFGQGISAMGMGLGMGLGIMLGGIISQNVGWRYVFIFFAIPSFLAGLLIWGVVREPFQSREQKASPPLPYAWVFMNRELWLINFTGFTVMYVFWVLGTWIPAVFREQGISKLTESSFYGSVIGLVAIPGLPASGYFSDWVVKKGKGRKLIIVVEILTLSFLIWMIGKSAELKWSVSLMLGLVLLAGLFLWSFFAPFYALISDLVPKDVLGTTFGLTNTICFMGSLIAPWLTGALRDLTGDFAWGFYSSAALLWLGALSIAAVKPAFQWGPEPKLQARS